MDKESIERVKKIIDKLDAIQEQIDKLNEKINLMHDEGNIKGLRKKRLYSYQLKERALLEKVRLLDIELRFLKPPIKSNGVIELRKWFNKDSYSICLCGERCEVGVINYRGYHDSFCYGDIGYVIYKKYRGNNYAYQSLCLLSELLKERGINDFLISAEVKNIASNKTIQKYGGMLIDNINGIYVYDCKTRKSHKKTLNKSFVK